MKLGELLIRIGVSSCVLKPGVSRDCEIILMPEESDGFGVKEVLHFQKDHQLWLVIDEDGDRWLTQDEDTGPPDDAPICEREGDMCALPEVRGDVCTNPFCVNGLTELGPCMICPRGKSLNEEKEKPDICELSRHKARQA